MSTLTAARPADSLMTSLARAGWGDLSGRHLAGVRTTLRALVDLLPHGSAAGFVTAPQVADVANLSERWVRRCMQLLEDAGLITWTRGGVAFGQPQPSHVRISKRLVVEIIRGARPMLAAIQRARAERTAARVRGLQGIVRTRDAHRRRSGHAELSASLHPLRGEEPTSAPLRPIENDSPDPVVAARGAALAREALRAARRRRP